MDSEGAVFESFNKLNDIEIYNTKHVKAARTKSLIDKYPELARQVAKDLMSMIASGWDEGKTGNFKEGHISTARVSLANLVREKNLDWGLMFRFITETPELTEEFQKMNKARAALIAGQIIDIADSHAETMVEAVDKKTRIDARKWIAEHDDRESYGNRTIIESNVTIEVNKIVDLNDRLKNATTFVSRVVNGDDKCLVYDDATLDDDAVLEEECAAVEPATVTNISDYQNNAAEEPKHVVENNGSVRKNKKWTNDILLEMLEKHRAGMNQNQIASYYGTSQPHVCLLLRKAKTIAKN